MSARTILGISGWVMIAVVGGVYFLRREGPEAPPTPVATVAAATSVTTVATAPASASATAAASASATTPATTSTVTRSTATVIPDPRRDPLRYAQWFCGQNRDRIFREAQTRDVDRAATWYANGVATNIRLQTYDGCRIGLLETEP